MKTLNSPILFIFALMGFVWLAIYSQPQQGYSAKDRADLDKLVAKSLAVTEKEKLAYRQARAYAELYGVDHKTTTDIFGERK